MIKLHRRAWLLSLTASAFVAARPLRARAAESGLDEPLRQLYAALEAAMKAGRAAPFSQRFADLAPAVDRAFDLETILKISIGMRWDSIDPDIRARLVKIYRRFTVATYVANFDKYDGEHFQILPGSRDAGADRIVATEMVAAKGPPLRLDYLMRDDNGTWRAVDVLLDGTISRVAVQRSDFRKILVSSDAEALIASLKRKIADLSDGALSS